MTSRTITPFKTNVSEPRRGSHRQFRGTLKNTKASGLIFASAVFVLLLLAPLAYSVSHFSADSLIYPTSVVLTILFAVQIWSWHRVSRSLFDPYIIFAIAAMLFNGSRAVLETFGLNRADVIGPQFSDQTTETTLYLVTLALWSYHMGGIYGASGRRPIKAIRGKIPAANHDHQRVLGWLMIGIAVVPAFIVLRLAITVAMSSGYFALFQREAATSLNALPQVLAGFLVPGAFWVATFSKGKRLQLAMTGALIGLYALVQLFLGSRVEAVTSIVPYVWVWHRCIKPVPKIPTIIAGLVLFVVVLPLVRVSRSFVGEDRFSPSALIQTFDSINNPAVSIVSEMGFSASTVAYTVELVPESRPYDYGTSYGIGFLTLVPNLYRHLRPAMAYGTPSSWLIQTVDPYTAARGGGLGYSFIAEAYLNAGWAGVILVSGMLGFTFAKLATSFSNTGDLAKIACTAVILVFALKYARNDSTEFVRGVVWYALGPYVLARAVSLKHVFNAINPRHLFDFRGVRGQ
jgi:oligosaccharide repeat unit polymerase